MEFSEHEYYDCDIGNISNVGDYSSSESGGLVRPNVKNRIWDHSKSNNILTVDNILIETQNFNLIKFYRLSKF